MLLSTMTTYEARQVFKEKKLAIVPIGSTEQHGCHMPLGTDKILASEVACRVGEKCQVSVLPAIGRRFYNKSCSRIDLVESIRFSTY